MSDDEVPVRYGQRYQKKGASKKMVRVLDVSKEKIVVQEMVSGRKHTLTRDKLLRSYTRY